MKDYKNLILCLHLHYYALFESKASIIKMKFLSSTKSKKQSQTLCIYIYSFLVPNTSLPAILPETKIKFNY